MALRAPFRAPHPISLTHIRTFTSTPFLQAKSTKNYLKELHAGIPPYPYGPSQIYKQSNFGLYGEQKIRYGNIVSKKNEIKTRRHWRPNVQSKRLYSEALKRQIRVRITTRVLRTVDKCGGLDNYLLGDKAQRIKELGMEGWRLRWRIMQTDKVKERFRKQREELGLPTLLEAQLTTPISELERVAAIAEIDGELDKDAELAVGEVEEEFVEDRGFMEEKTPPPPTKLVA
ncbi:hypothetical protein BJ875DRAFT_377769 [Amylocarpus encephaloides]|uniref:Large ribosomal subunit protein bL28m n=1 Tax=Amylocarpus encephaloides TaxID=45428 RepID=A0A9P7YH68_9HELO|nr:hypothetical protein BJ875DRAFT_377769 [Amylocarpus encephaloides]